MPPVTRFPALVTACHPFSGLFWLVHETVSAPEPRKIEGWLTSATRRNFVNEPHSVLYRITVSIFPETLIDDMFNYEEESGVHVSE